MAKGQSTKIERVCAVCGKQFFTTPWEARRNSGVKYCSRPCYFAARRIPLHILFNRGIGATTATGCILWADTTDAKGYGIIYASAKKPQRLFLAHRLAWEYANGAIPSGLCVLHRCDTPLCINPDHLFLGTQLDNIADMARKERQANRKLTTQAVREIRQRYTAGGISQQKLADEYGVDQTTVSKVILGNAWMHVEE